jgi:hypothetical protein
MRLPQRFSHCQSFILFPTALAGEYSHNALTPLFYFTPRYEGAALPVKAKPAKKARPPMASASCA